jgi:hypothetical protein
MFSSRPIVAEAGPSPCRRRFRGSACCFKPCDRFGVLQPRFRRVALGKGKQTENNDLHVIRTCTYSTCLLFVVPRLFLRSSFGAYGCAHRLDRSSPVDNTHQDLLQSDLNLRSIQYRRGENNPQRG